MNTRLLIFTLTWLEDVKSGEIYETDGSYSLNELEVDKFFKNISIVEVNQMCKFINDQKILSGKSYLWSYDYTINIVK